jgi:hypothetical protein
MIGRVADGLPLAASVHNDMRDDVKYLLLFPLNLVLI